MKNNLNSYYKYILLLCCGLASISRPNAQVLSNKKDITIAIWNIGHFSMGHKDYSLIKASEYNEKVNEYRDFLYNKLKVDILCVNEFESEFCRDSILGCAIAEEVLFNKFKEQRILKKNRYVWNAIFSNVGLNDTRKRRFKYDMKTPNEIKNISWFYYVTTDIIIGQYTVKLVCTHLISRHEQECQKQMKQLIEDFSSYDKVIICGDMNSSDWSQFKKAGYSLANDGSLVTFPKRSCALDNIIVKGLKISDVRVIRTKLSDHYPLICKILNY